MPACLVSLEREAAVPAPNGLPSCHQPARPCPAIHREAEEAAKAEAGKTGEADEGLEAKASAKIERAPSNIIQRTASNISQRVESIKSSKFGQAVGRNKIVKWLMFGINYDV